MHNLIVALLQPAVYIYVFNVEDSKMLKCFIGLPCLNVLDAQLILLGGHRLDLDLLCQIVHHICQLKVKGYVRHF